MLRTVAYVQSTILYFNIWKNVEFTFQAWITNASRFLFRGYVYKLLFTIRRDHLAHFMRTWTVKPWILHIESCWEILCACEWASLQRDRKRWSEKWERERECIIFEFCVRNQHGIKSTAYSYFNVMINEFSFNLNCTAKLWQIFPSIPFQWKKQTKASSNADSRYASNLNTAIELGEIESP